MIKHAKDIRILLERRLRLWSECEWDILINEAVTLDKKLMNRGYGNGNDISKIFHSQMARGKVKEAMRRLTEEVDTSVLDPMKIIDDAGTTVLDDLKSKHPLPTIPDPESLHIPSGFTEIPPLLQVQVTADIVEVVARKLHGGGGPSGSKADQWADFLLRHGRSSTHLREAVAALANRLGNEDVPWDSIRALVASRLVALDKCPGVRPIGVGECLRRILAKCMAEVSGDEVTSACKGNQLAGGLSGGIEGAVHAMNKLYQEKALPNSNWGLLLVDAKNAFNSVNRIKALWYARFHWPSCSRFLYNTYKAHAELVLRGGVVNLHSREGVTQGDPLAMLLYALSTLPLIEDLKASNVQQCWYADDSSAQGSFYGFERLVG
ncbi:hypothetical protein GE061_004774 [Apolygus lucorum]|uniref:Reverse transcriptase domain-containing protein n=1 Tax=Apolygus lucorum TaxID=248454 RepID=A0A8S9X455_APOLU|nr:hypothetical protein GE061_004774 [Apolygus lucorum]